VENAEIRCAAGLRADPRKHWGSGHSAGGVRGEREGADASAGQCGGAQWHPRTPDSRALGRSADLSSRQIYWLLQPHGRWSVVLAPALVGANTPCSVIGRIKASIQNAKATLITGMLAALGRGAAVTGALACAASRPVIERFLLQNHFRFLPFRPGPARCYG
jgi:hypothetical protein